MMPLATDQQRAVRAWCLYDWANSAFATTVMAAMYPPFFRSLAVAAGLHAHQATAYWGYTTAAAMLLISLAAPVLGAIADHGAHRKHLLAVFAAMGITATSCFVLNGDDTWVLAALLFVFASIGFTGGNVFYESLLPSLVPAKHIDRVSALGYGLGYLGGGVLLVINAMWVLAPGWFGFADAGVAVRASFVSVALWWGAFSIPLFRRVAEPPAGRRGDARRNVIVEGFQRLLATLREIRRYRQLVLFLVAFWIYGDGISTIIKMATAYGDELGIGLGHLIGALVLTQFVGFPFSLAFGRLAGRIGAKAGILLALSVYTAVSIGGYFMASALHFYILAGVVGMVQGGSQALSRSLFATMVPRHRSAEFFGFFSASSKFAGIAGPLVFGVVSQVTGNSRLSIVALVVFFVVGGSLLSRVDQEAGVRAARDAEVRDGYRVPEHGAARNDGA